MRLNCLQLRLVHRFIGSSARDLVTPPPPATEATANLDASARRGSVNYMVDHICEPMPSTGSQHLPNYAARCKMGAKHRSDVRSHAPGRTETVRSTQRLERDDRAQVGAEPEGRRRDRALMRGLGLPHFRV